MRDIVMDMRRRLPRIAAGAAVAKAIEALLLILVTIQGARLFWAIVTPIGMFGDWQARQPAILAPAARTAVFGSFDPFFREASVGAGSGQVTSLALILFGTRLNEGSGQGSAIIATPDGIQSSYVVGDAIMPGVTLKQVAYDHVVIDRGGAAENLFLDQSSEAGALSPGEMNHPPTAPSPSAAAMAGLLTADAISRDIVFAPRTDSGRITGIAVSPRGEGEAFIKAGFQPGDVVTQVNGRPIASAADLQAAQAQIRSGARLSFMVERGAATLPLTIVVSGGMAGR